MDAISYSYADKQAKRIKKIINDPDSNSGVVTVPKVIASGDSVTIPAGRVAILPNVQVDGTLTVLGDVFVPSGSTFGDLDAQIALKANINSPVFTGTPSLPTGTTAVTQTAGDNSTKLATTAFVTAAASTGFDAAHSFSQNGYQKLSNGLILQWGYLATGSSGNKTVTFPIAFPTACLNVNPTMVGTIAAYEASVVSSSVSNFVFYQGTPGCSGAYWFAIGY